MKIAPVNSETLNLDDVSQIDFGISKEDEGFVMEILRSKIYPYPINAICREIASNARDSHREKGIPNVPIEIEILNNPHLFSINNLSDSCKIIFRDFGVGLSEEKIKEVFVQYGKSTRRNSNKFTGGYGIGSKTPFSYTDQFNVISRYGGKETLYLCYIDEQRKGKMLKVSEKEINPELTGLEVIISLSEKDVHEFETQCYYYTNFWEIRPIFKGFSIPDTLNKNNLIEKIGNFEIYKKSRTSFIKNSLFVIDGIPYDVSKYFNEYGVNFVFYFDNGVVNIPAHRETLQFDDVTLQIIEKCEETIKTQIIEHFQNYFNACYNERETFLLLNEILCNLPSKISDLFLNNVTDFLGRDLFFYKISVYRKNFRDVFYKSQNYLNPSLFINNDKNIFEKENLIVYLKTSKNKAENSRLYLSQLEKDFIKQQLFPHDEEVIQIENPKMLEILQDIHGEENVIFFNLEKKRIKSEAKEFLIHSANNKGTLHLIYNPETKKIEFKEKAIYVYNYTYGNIVERNNLDVLYISYESLRKLGLKDFFLDKVRDFLKDNEHEGVLFVKNYIKQKYHFVIRNANNYLLYQKLNNAVYKDFYPELFKTKAYKGVIKAKNKFEKVLNMNINELRFINIRNFEARNLFFDKKLKEFEEQNPILKLVKELVLTKEKKEIIRQYIKK